LLVLAVPLDEPLDELVDDDDEDEDDELLELLELPLNSELNNADVPGETPLMLILTS
jgi:hypothetical protein